MHINELVDNVLMARKENPDAEVYLDLNDGYGSLGRTSYIDLVSDTNAKEVLITNIDMNSS